MPIFETADQLYTCIGGLFQKMKNDPTVKDLSQKIKLSVKFTFTEPNAVITLISADGDQSIYFGETDQKTDVELIMSGDVAHHFWMGEIKVMDALTRRQITPIGSLAKIMTLVPIIKSAIALYPKHFKKFSN